MDKEALLDGYNLIKGTTKALGEADTWDALPGMGALSTGLSYLPGIGGEQSQGAFGSKVLKDRKRLTQVLDAQDVAQRKSDDVTNRLYGKPGGGALTSALRMAGADVGKHTASGATEQVSNTIGDFWKSHGKGILGGGAGLLGLAALFMAMNNKPQAVSRAYQPTLQRLRTQVYR